jgi:hypothetical protein
VTAAVIQCESGIVRSHIALSKNRRRDLRRFRELLPPEKAIASGNNSLTDAG